MFSYIWNNFKTWWQNRKTADTTSGNAIPQGVEPPNFVKVFLNWRYALLGVTFLFSLLIAQQAYNWTHHLLMMLFGSGEYTGNMALVLRDFLLPVAVSIYVLYVVFDAITERIPVGQQAIPLFFGQRVVGVVLKEGLNLHIPLLFECEKEKVTTQTIDDLVIKDVISSDNIVVEEVAVTVQFRIFDLFCYKSTDRPLNALRGLLESALRRTMSLYEGAKIAGLSSDISEKVLAPSQEKDTPVPGQEKDTPKSSVVDEAAAWGIQIKDVYIKNVKLPKKVAEALSSIQAETRQKEAQLVEAGLVVEIDEILKKTGLSPERRQQTIHAIIEKQLPSFFIDGTSGELMKAAAMFSGFVESQTKGGEK